MGTMIKSLKEVLNNKKYSLILAFAFFIFMMLYNLMHSAVWGDEWVEYLTSQESIINGDFYSRVINTFQPPLYNVIMHFWLKLNQSLLWFRFFGVIVGCISGAFLYLTLKVLYNDNVAKIGLCFLAVCYRWIYCVQECSEYILMVGVLFGAVYFYVITLKSFSFKKFLLFIFFSVLSIYSQYGSVFVCAPLLCILFITYVFKKDVGKLVKLEIVVSYILSFILFAIPLYKFFLSEQLQHNQISSHVVEISADMFYDLPFALGQICAYFFNVHTSIIWLVIMSLVGVWFAAVSVAIYGNCDWIKKSLVLTMWIAYVVHYMMVQLHIYAMMSPGRSGGFFIRYSYFYIPIFFVVVPILVKEFLSVNRISKMAKYTIIIMIAGIICVSFVGIIKNWHKSLDDKFAEIWIENEGWKDTTYLFGPMTYPGFQYYIAQSNGFEDYYFDNVYIYSDINELPDRFWAWRSNWNGSEWDTVVDKAYQEGYQVVVFYDYVVPIDSDNKCQLAFCYKE